MTLISNDILVRAIASNELEKFLIGEPPYFLEAKNDNEEPQNVSQAFDSLIIPYWKRTKNVGFPLEFLRALINLIDAYPDKNRAIYVVHDWIWYYLFCLGKKRVQPFGHYGDLFEIDLGELAALLKKCLEDNKRGLIADQRWAGGLWNSKNGMWEALLRTSEAVRDKLNGPDFVPANS